MYTDSEVIKNFQTLDIEEHIKMLLDNNMPNHTTSKQILAVYKAHSLNQEVFNALISFCHQVIGMVFLESIIPLAKRWERLGIDTAEKAMEQARFEYEVISTFESGITLNAKFMYSNFDYNQFRSGLSEHMVPKETLSSIAKDTIVKLAFLYSFTPIDMQKVVIMALDEDLKLSEDRLRKSSAELFKMTRAYNK